LHAAAFPICPTIDDLFDVAAAKERIHFSLFRWSRDPHKSRVQIMPLAADASGAHGIIIQRRACWSNSNRLLRLQLEQ